MTYAIGAGPLDDASVQNQVCEILNRVDILTVRERIAKKLLEDVGVHRDIIVTADPALLLKPEPLPKNALEIEHFSGKERVVGISIRESGLATPDLDQQFYHSLLADAADYLVDRFDAYIIFFPMEQKMRDLQVSHAVMAQMLYPQRAHVRAGDYTAGQLLSLIKHCVFAVGMRLHFLIFAALQNVPFVALPYSAKVGGLLDELKLEMPPVNLVNSGRLIAHIDRSWDQADVLKEKIRKALPPLIQEARKTNEYAVSLLLRKTDGYEPKKNRTRVM